MKKKLIAGMSALVLATGAGAAGVQLASADDTSPSPSAGPTTDTPKNSDDGGTHGKGGPHVEREGAELAGLAEKLGVEESALRDAVQKARESMGEPERPDKDSTQAERDAARDEHQAAFAKALATELGIEEAKVTQAFDELRAEADQKHAADEKEVLDQAVADGKLTRTEADAVQKALDADIVRVGGERPGGGGRR